MFMDASAKAGDTKKTIVDIVIARAQSARM
jgi:hypothetical protein